MTAHESNPRRRRRPASAAVGGHQPSEQLVRACRDCADMAVLTAITALAAICVGAWHWESGAVMAVFAGMFAIAAIAAYLGEVRPALRDQQQLHHHPSNWRLTRRNTTPRKDSTRC